MRLTERHVRHDPPLTSEVAALIAEVEPALAALPAAGGRWRAFQLVGTAGTVTTLAAMAQDLATYDPARVHGYRLQRLRAGGPDRAPGRGRPRPSASRWRAWIRDGRTSSWPGPASCAAFVRRLDAPYVLVNDRGIRWGLLYEKLGELRRRLTRRLPAGGAAG